MRRSLVLLAAAGLLGALVAAVQAPVVEKVDPPGWWTGSTVNQVRQHLPYLKALGVTAIWLNPVYDNNNELNKRETYDGQPITDYHGYGAVDFYAVDEHFGDLRAFRELVDAAHAQGLKIILDMVA